MKKAVAIKLNDRYAKLMDWSCPLHHSNNDVIDLTHSVSLALDRLVCCYCFLHDLYKVPTTMRLCNSRLPEEHFVCYQTSQRNWVIIKELYRCLRRYMLSWRISRLVFVTPIVGEVSLGPLGNAHHLSLASIATT